MSLVSPFLGSSKHCRSHSMTLWWLVTSALQNHCAIEGDSAHLSSIYHLNRDCPLRLLEVCGQWFVLLLRPQSCLFSAVDLTFLLSVSVAHCADGGIDLLLLLQPWRFLPFPESRPPSLLTPRHPFLMGHLLYWTQSSFRARTWTDDNNFSFRPQHWAQCSADVCRPSCPCKRIDLSFCRTWVFWTRSTFMNCAFSQQVTFSLPEFPCQ